MPRFDLDSFTRDLQSVAAVTFASDVFSLLSRRLIVPTSCMALAWADSGQPELLRAGSELESGHWRRLMFVRVDPTSLLYHFSKLPSADGFDFKAKISLRVQLVPQRDELASFHRAVIGSGDRVSLEQLQRHCDEIVRVSAASFVRERGAADLSNVAAWSAFDAALAERFKPFGFACGLGLCPDVRAEFTSEAFDAARHDQRSAEQRHKRLAEETALRESAAAARESHLSSLASMLDKVRSMAGESGEARVSELIRTFDAAHRAQLYAGLLSAASSRRTEAILVVAGAELLVIEPASPGKIALRRSFGADLGPLRSVRVSRVGEDVSILLGARSGVYRLDDEYSLKQQFAFTTPPAPRGGVNAAIIQNGFIYATHSEAGLRRWRIHDGDERQANAAVADTHANIERGADDAESCLPQLTAGAKSVRDVQLGNDGTLWLTVGARVVGWRPDSTDAPVLLTAPSEVSALCIAEGWVCAGLKDGRLLRWPTRVPHDLEELRGPTGQAVESLDWLSGGGIARLLIADRRTTLDLQVIGDGYRGEYRAALPLRWAWAADDWIVAVNDNRDRLMLWRPSEPQSPAAIVPIGQLCGNTVQDAALVGARL